MKVCKRNKIKEFTVKINMPKYITDIPGYSCMFSQLSPIKLYKFKHCNKVIFGGKNYNILSKAELRKKVRRKVKGFKHISAGNNLTISITEFTSHLATPKLFTETINPIGLPDITFGIVSNLTITRPTVEQNNVNDVVIPN